MKGREDMFKAEGIIPAMVTPFDREEQIDENSLRFIVKRLMKSGVHGLFCLGTNGEFFSLSEKEKIRVVEIVLEENNGKLKIYAGSGSRSTKETIRLSREFEALGVDALSIITPDFLSFTQRELYNYYQQVAAETSLPIILYNIPARTGNALQPNIVFELSKIPNIVGIKDSSGNYDNILEYIEQTDSNFSVLAGNDSLILSTLLAGGTGAIAATANVFPEVVVSIYEYWKEGKINDAELAQRKLRALRNAFRLGTLPSVLKAAMHKVGISAGLPRLPVAPLSIEANLELDSIFENYNRKP